MNLSELAIAVKSNYTKLDEAQVVGRVMLISGRNFTASMKGYKILQDAKLIDNLVEKKTQGMLQKMIANNPYLAELFDDWQCIPQKLTVEEAKPYTPVPKIDRNAFIQALAIGEF